MTLQCNSERQLLIHRAECEGQTCTWTAVLACSQSAPMYTCHGQTPLALALTTLQCNSERQLLIHRAECEGQTCTWTAVLACSQAAPTYTCHGQTPLALALTTLQGNPERQPLVQRPECEGQTNTWTAVLACSQAASHFSLLSLSSCFSFCCMCPSASHSLATLWNSLTFVTLQPCLGFGIQGLGVLPYCLPL